MYRAWTLIYFYRDYHGTIRDVDLINKMSKRAYNSCWGEPCGLLKGQALYKLGKYEEAIKVFDTVLVEEKIGIQYWSQFLVHFYKGRCFHSLNDFSNALKSYGLVLQLDPNYTEALYQVGLIYKSKGENALALQNLTKAKEWLKRGKNGRTILWEIWWSFRISDWWSYSWIKLSLTNYMGSNRFRLQWKWNNSKHCPILFYF